MTSGDHYRSLSSQFSARAKSERNLKFRAEWNYLATCYLRLAEQADRNLQTDIAYEPPVTSAGAERDLPPTAVRDDEQGAP